MRAIDLKRKYLKFWRSVEKEVYADLKACLPGHMLDTPRMDMIAHNAAFIACHNLHRRLMVK